MEDTLDQCIDEGKRSLDQMCFSSQFYMMDTIHMGGMILFILGLQTILHAEYNLFGDPATIVLFPYVIFSCIIVKYICSFVADVFGIWRLKDDATGFHISLSGPTPIDEFGVPQWEELGVTSHEAYLLNQKLTSETFRYKFLNYNRPWLVSQLPNILTPRTLRRGAPFLISQLARVLGTVNPDISSESSGDDQPIKFGPVRLSSTSKSIAIMWLAEARKRRRLRDVVKGIISNARKQECEQCLSRQQLHVDVIIPIEVLAERFEEEQGESVEVFDQVIKRFYT